MLTTLRRIAQFSWVTTKNIGRLGKRFISGSKKIGVIKTTKTFLAIVEEGSNFLVREFSNLLHLRIENGGQNSLLYPKDLSDLPEASPLAKLRKTAQGLHQLLPNWENYGYSILIPVFRPNKKYFYTAVQSALNQSAPQMEVILGLDGEQPQEIHQVISELQKTHPKGGCLKAIQLDRSEGAGGISRTTNAISKLAKYPFLLLMDHDDWIRPDLLYRYEQTLRLQAAPKKTVLYCDEFKIDENDQPIQRSHLEKPEIPPFPYVFVNFICHCLLIPRDLWNEVGGLNAERDGAQDYDLTLRLDLAGAKFRNVPIYLYAWRSHAQSTAKSSEQKDYATPAGVKALTAYVEQKNLSWDVTAGRTPTTYRAIPKVPSDPRVQAVMLYKDREDLTLPAIDSLLAQEVNGVPAQKWLSILAIDNGSSDKGIAEKIRAKGAQVLRVDEPFNFSRLCNLGAANSGGENSAPYLLMINNDVYLDTGAIEEMLRWVDQPGVGIVGCQLRYPSGRLQHGGVQLEGDSEASRRMLWIHSECGAEVAQAGFANVLSITDAVTAACCLVRRDLFDRVGGFDEVNYPIAYSDTNLCTKIQKAGLLPFYTPFATGIHKESETRGMGNIEDFENSWWLERQLFSQKPHHAYPYQFGIKGFKTKKITFR